jgi:hypothetical protein
MEHVAYGGWPGCCRLSNGVVELIVTGDVGPRVIRFGLAGGDNEFVEIPGQAGLTGGDEWIPYGGHRLWHAPEAMPRTYAPDNSPVQVADHGEFVRVTQPVEAQTGIRKEMDIRLRPGQAHARIVHRLANHGAWPVRLAPWGLSMMAPGGVAIIPLPPRGTHDEYLLPTGSLALWAYTDLSDPRWTWGAKHILLRQDPARPAPLKIGVMAPAGWLAYWRDGRLFVKIVEVQPGAEYPDRGSPLEVYADGALLELETLGPLAWLEPGASVEHVEDWFVFPAVPDPRIGADAEQHIDGLAHQARLLAG